MGHAADGDDLPRMHQQHRRVVGGLRDGAEPAGGELWHGVSLSQVSPDTRSWGGEQCRAGLWLRRRRSPGGDRDIPHEFCKASGSAGVCSFNRSDQMTAMRCTEEAGAVAVEFALVLPILILLVFGSVEFGLALYNKEVITNAGREGARAGIIIGNPRPTATQITTVVQAYLTGAGLNATQATVTVKAPV